MNGLRRWMLGGLLLLAVSVRAAGIGEFYGSYEGVALSSVVEEIQPRDLAVRIGPYRNHGFTVSWTTLIRKSDGRIKRSETSVNFEPAPRDGVYGAAMRRTMFGESAPLDPLRGDPFVWATVNGGTMTVHELIITESGGYELHTYTRRLLDDGMHVVFNTVRDSAVLRTVEGTLRRTSRSGER